MIIATLAHIEEQVISSPALVYAFSFLKNLDSTVLQEGRKEIDGKRVFAIISAYTTKPVENDVELEGHKKYIDLQYLVEGEEAIAWIPAEQVPVTCPYQPDRDAWTGNLPAESVSWLRLCAGQVALLYPSDAHAAQQAFIKPAPVLKVVVKVAVE